ncbi:MAG: hypothetical protein U0930_20015 [Pirellulales bacterium]
MATKWIDIAESLRGKLATALGVTVERQYMAYTDRELLKTGKYLVVGAGDDLEGSRGIDHSLDQRRRWLSDWSAPIRLPNGPINVETWLSLDQYAGKVQQIKDLFGEDGSLRNDDFAGGTFILLSTMIRRTDLIY